jgi:hypothetical protein
LLVVVVSGRPRPAEWNRHLDSAGYEVLRHPARSAGRAVGSLVVGQPRSAAAEARAAVTGYRRFVAGRHRAVAAAPAVPLAQSVQTS